jgi:hypothetical protein
MAISVWEEKYERARAGLANLREKTKSVAINARYDLETVAAGGLAGAIRGAFEASGKTYAIPGPNGTMVPPEVPAGLALLAIAYSGKSEASQDFHRAGAGVLAYSAGRELENWMRTKGAKPAGAVQ